MKNNNYLQLIYKEVKSVYFNLPKVPKTKKNW